MEPTSPLLDTALHKPLSEMIAGRPLSCAPDTAVDVAVRSMRARSVGSIVAVDPSDRPVGIFTLRDLLAAIATDTGDLSRPLSDYMSRGLACLPVSATAFDAALLMAERGIRHVVVVSDRRFAGVVSERDLFRLQASGPHRLAYAIRAADDTGALVTLARRAHDVGRAAVDQAMAPAHATRLVSMLNDLVTRRAVELAFRRALPSGATICWIALGSEGRNEQTLKTDQDNGIVFSAPGPAEAVRATLSGMADGVNRLLADCGIALCEGGIMAGNPRWCMSLDEWRTTFSDWIVHSDAEALMHCSIFFDFRSVWGEEALADDLRAHLDGAVAANGRFLLQLARNALDREPPLGVLRDFSLERGGEHDHTLDLKLHGTSLFVDVARVYALKHGVREVDTVRRLAAVAGPQGWPEIDADAWADAFLCLQKLRLEGQRRAERESRPPTNRLDPDVLNPVDRRMLHESLRQAKRLQQRLALDFRMLERGW
jgi:CBS domain-containing protein